MAPSPRRAVAQLAASAVTLVTLAGAALLWFGGFKFHVVETASMSPSIPTGALALVRPVAVDEVDKGDVIAFADPSQTSRVILHRVERVLTDEAGHRHFATKGDANPDVDFFPVSGSSLQGRSEFVIPRAGAVGRMFTEDWAPYALGGIPTLFWLLSVVRDRRRRRTPDEPTPVESPRPAGAHYFAAG